MISQKLLAIIKVGVIFVTGAGILVSLGLFMDGIESQALKKDVMEFSALQGISGTPARESKMEGESVLAAYGLRAPGKVSGYVLYLECAGFTGKTRFLCAFAPSGSMRGLGRMAASDNYIVAKEWPEGDALSAMLSSKNGTTRETVAENDEASILIAGLNGAIEAGRAAIEKGKGGSR
jgi:hypothetical protein